MSWPLRRVVLVAVPGAASFIVERVSPQKAADIGMAETLVLFDRSGSYRLASTYRCDQMKLTRF